MTNNLCKYRGIDGNLCELPDATYGVTIRSPVTNQPFYTVMVCKKHWIEYLEDPGAFINRHEIGCVVFLARLEPGGVIVI